MKGKLLTAAIIMMCVLIVIGIILSLYFVTHTNRRDTIYVNLEKGDEQIIDFSPRSLSPGSQVSYTISVRTELKSESTVILSFFETAEGGLEDHVYVRVTAYGEELIDERLSTLFERGEIDLGRTILPSEPFEFEVSYYLPLAVGNEAQGASAIFALSVKASNQ